MKYALLVIGNGRDYIYSTAPAAIHNIGGPLHYRLMVNDSPSLAWREQLTNAFSDFTITHTGGVGMAGAVQAGFDLVLSTDADYVIWIEDDMLVTAPLPLAAAASVLHTHPMTIAQMCFRREPWWGSPAEIEHGDQLAAICAQADNVHQSANGYTVHDFLFSLNPCLIPRAILKLGWPSGPLGVGNESGMTTKLRSLGYAFGSWGHPGDGQVWARHLGEQRAEGWKL